MGQFLVEKALQNKVGREKDKDEEKKEKTRRENLGVISVQKCSFSSCSVYLLFDFFFACFFLFLFFFFCLFTRILPTICIGFSLQSASPSTNTDRCIQNQIQELKCALVATQVGSQQLNIIERQVLKGFRRGMKKDEGGGTNEMKLKKKTGTLA